MFYFPFFIKVQNDFLLKKAGKLTDIPKDKREPIRAEVHRFGVLFAQKSHDYEAYHMATKTWGGLFRSFIPTTGEFNVRVRCAKQIAIVDERLSAIKRMGCRL